MGELMFVECSRVGLAPQPAFMFSPGGQPGVWLTESHSVVTCCQHGLLKERAQAHGLSSWLPTTRAISVADFASESTCYTHRRSDRWPLAYADMSWASLLPGRAQCPDALSWFDSPGAHHVEVASMCLPSLAHQRLFVPQACGGDLNAHISPCPCLAGIV